MKNMALILSVFGVLASHNSSAQTVNDYINSYSDDNRFGYLQPLADLTIGGLNAGLPLSDSIGNNLYIKFNLTGLYIKPTNNQRTFTATTPETFSEELSEEVSTIIGPNEVTRVMASNGTTYVFPSGYALDYLPWAIPQLSIGGIYGSEVSLRFFTWDTKDDFGKFMQLGIGARHSLDRYLPDLPVSINLGYQYNNVEIGRYMKLQSHYIYLQGGYNIGILDLLVYGGYQTGNFDVNYEAIVDETVQNIETRLKNEDPFLGGLIAQLRFGIFSVSAGIAGPQPVVASAGIGLTFGGKATSPETEIETEEDINETP